MDYKMLGFEDIKKSFKVENGEIFSWNYSHKLKSFLT